MKFPGNKINKGTLRKWNHIDYTFYGSMQSEKHYRHMLNVTAFLFMSKYINKIALPFKCLSRWSFI